MKTKIVLLLVLLWSSLACGALTYDQDYYLTHQNYGGTLSPIYLFMNEVCGYLEGDTTFSTINPVSYTHLTLPTN